MSTTVHPGFIDVTSFFSLHSLTTHFKTCSERKKLLDLTPPKKHPCVFQNIDPDIENKEDRKSDEEVIKDFCSFAKSEIGGSCGQKTVVAYKTQLQRIIRAEKERFDNLFKAR